MAWFKVDDYFYDHPKVLECSTAAIGLWTLAASYASRHLTDGFVSNRCAERFGSDEEILELVSSGLWEETEGGYLFHDWHKYNPSASRIQEIRRKRAEAGRKGGKARAANRHDESPKHFAKQSDKQNAGDVPGTTEAKLNPVPVPLPTDVAKAPSVGGVGGIVNDEPGSTPPGPDKPDQEGRPPPRRRRRPLPEDWEPGPRHADRVAAYNALQRPGWGLSLTQEADEFRAWTAARDKRYADWDHAFTNHLVRAEKRGGYRLPTPVPETPHQARARIARERRERRAEQDRWRRYRQAHPDAARKAVQDLPDSDLKRRILATDPGKEP